MRVIKETSRDILNEKVTTELSVEELAVVTAIVGEFTYESTANRVHDSLLTQEIKGSVNPKVSADFYNASAEYLRSRSMIE